LIYEELKAKTCPVTKFRRFRALIRASVPNSLSVFLPNGITKFSICHRIALRRIVFAQMVAIRSPICSAIHLREGSSMQAKDFLRMFAYDYWANRECLAAMRTAGAISADTIGRTAHILSAQKLWLERILKERQSMPVWPSSTIQDCVALADEMSSAWRNYLTRVGNQFAPGSLDDQVEYRNSKGEPWSSRVEDILTHVLLHSTYHRGQIALQMRASGVEPAHTDFIHAVRQGLVE
jgi:uncharacterized damage-inducible protein DinB